MPRLVTGSCVPLSDFGRRHVSPEGEVDSAFSASQAGAFDPVIDFLSQSEVVAHGSTHHLFMDQPDGVRKLLCDMSQESFAHHNVIAIGNSNEDPHMILVRPFSASSRASAAMFVLTWRYVLPGQPFLPVPSRCFSWCSVLLPQPFPLVRRARQCQACPDCHVACSVAMGRAHDRRSIP